jgi:signal transduction histidine kinase
MRGSTGARRWRDFDPATAELLYDRIRMIPLIVIAGNLLFATTDPWLHHGGLLGLYLLKALVIGAELVALRLLQNASTADAIRIGLACFAIGAAGGTVAGITVGDSFTTPLLCVAGAFTSAAVVPWGAAPQLVMALIAAVAATVTIAATIGSEGGYPLVAVATVTVLSVFIAHELSRHRAAEARATLELARRQSELAHVLRVSAMGEMGAQLAHELTQPLSAIANYAAGCRRRLQLEAPRHEALVEAVERIGAEALRAGEIIRRLRGFVRKEEPRLQAVDVNTIVEEVVTLVGGDAREHGIDLQLTLDPALPTVEADPIQLEQVIFNLVRNALEATQPDPGPFAAVGIMTRRNGGGGVEVLVCDAGVGISDDEEHKIFEPFHTTKPSGLGMGLAISRSILEAHGGTLTMTRNQTRGVTFAFALPAREREPSAARATA